MWGIDVLTKNGGLRRIYFAFEGVGGRAGSNKGKKPVPIRNDLHGEKCKNAKKMHLKQNGKWVNSRAALFV